ncbi:hypothetical protein HpMS107_51540 [Helicobacter pylori]
MRVSTYLDRLQKAVNVPNDKELAKRMGWSHSVPSHWRTGKRFMDNATAGSISELIGVPVIEIIAAVEADREEMTGQKSFWTAFFQRTAGSPAMPAAVALVAVGVTKFVTSPALQASIGAVSQAAHSILC